MGHDLASNRSSSWVILALSASLGIAAACGGSSKADSTSASSASDGGAGSSAAGGTGSAGGGGASAGTMASSTGAGSGGASTGTTASSTGAGAGTPGCGAPQTAGTTKETLDVNGVLRTYLVVVPAGLDGGTPVPVILGFHGGSGTSEEASQYGLTGAEAALYVYPQAPYWPEAGGVGWNVDPAGVDFPFFDALLVDLGKKHCVDTTRVFAAGKSNGAFFVNSLACYRPSSLRAIAPVAGGGPQSGCTKGMAAMIVHGSADMTVQIAQGRYSRDYWLTANGCAGAPSAPTDPSPCVAYAGCADPVLWCEHGGAHTFPSFAAAGIRGFFLGL